MKNSIIYRYICAILVMGAPGACSDDEHYDFPGDSTNRVYLNVGNYTVNNYNGYSFSVIHTPAGSFGPDIGISFPVRCSLEAPSDMKVTLAIDNTLVGTYNAGNGTNYSALPGGVVTVEASTLTIAKGALASSDSLTVSVSPDKFSQLTDANYVLPVRIAAIDHDKAAISTNLNTVYVVIRTSETNCYDSPVLADMTGQLIPDRTAWFATLDADLSFGALPNIFDGSTGSQWRVAPPKRCTLTVDMAAEQEKIAGIRIHSQSTTYSFRSMDVYTSVDGENWVSQGAAVLSIASAYQYIKFYAPVTARYFKLEITGWRSSASIRMAEFDVYTED